MSRSTTADSFDAFSLLDEVEFASPPPSEVDLPPHPPCPSGLYGSLLTSQHPSVTGGNLVNAAFGGMLGSGRTDRPIMGGSGFRVSPLTTTMMPHQQQQQQQQQQRWSTTSFHPSTAPDSVSLASNLSAGDSRLCLLEVNRVTLSDMDLFSGVWVAAEQAEEDEVEIMEELRFEGRYVCVGGGEGEVVT